MKKMLSVMVLGIAGIAFANASEKEVVSFDQNRSVVSVVDQVIVAQDSVKRTMIEPASLPDAVINTLMGDDFNGWVIVSAYFVEPAEAASFYEVTLKKEDEEDARVVNLDESGNIID